LQEVISGKRPGKYGIGAKLGKTGRCKKLQHWAQMKLVYPRWNARFPLWEMA
jgi:hypothetical protein